MPLQPDIHGYTFSHPLFDVPRVGWGSEADALQYARQLHPPCDIARYNLAAMLADGYSPVDLHDVLTDKTLTIRDRLK
jgi:hypothetical protein